MKAPKYKIETSAPSKPALPPWWRDPIWRDLMRAWVPGAGETDDIFGLLCHERGWGPVYSGSRRGSFEGRGRLFARVMKLGGEILCKGGQDGTCTVLFERGYALVTEYPSSRGSALNWVVWDRALDRRLRQLARKLRRSAEGGKVETIVVGRNGPTCSPLGYAASRLERGNYHEDVLIAYDRACLDLGSSSPSGRLLCLSGPPGTGKTYLLRGIINDVAAASFVVVQPDTLVGLIGPGLMGALIDMRDEQDEREQGQKAIVLLVEDADSVLVTRMADNMSAVASLLNLCDGIIGEALDVRVVATTNAAKIEIDPALLRPGRLSAHVRTRELDVDHATAILHRLVPGDAIVTPQGKLITLADVYAQARKLGWVAPQRAVPDEKLHSRRFRKMHR